MPFPGQKFSLAKDLRINPASTLARHRGIEAPDGMPRLRLTPLRFPVTHSLSTPNFTFLLTVPKYILTTLLSLHSSLNLAQRQTSHDLDSGFELSDNITAPPLDNLELYNQTALQNSWDSNTCPCLTRYSRLPSRRIGPLVSRSQRSTYVSPGSFRN